MRLKRFIPNLLTLLNLLSGTIAAILAVENQLILAAYFVFLGIFFDFFDGLAARLLKVQGELGTQLDSLADVVTSGVVPGIVMYQLLLNKNNNELFNNDVISWDNEFSFLPYFGLIITLGAAYRLAKFNIDTRQTTSFIGLPTPASALVVLSFPLILTYTDSEFVINLIENKWFLLVVTALLTYLMNAELPLFALKFKNFSWKDNKDKFIFIALVLVLVILLEFIAIPLIILLYVLMSLVKTKLKY